MYQLVSTLLLDQILPYLLRLHNIGLEIEFFFVWNFL